VYQNNYDNTAQGGSAAKPLSYANVLEILAKGRLLKKPNGKPMPIRYDSLIVGPDNIDLALDITRKNFIAPSTGARGEAGSVLVENSITRYDLRVIYLPQLSDPGAWYMGAFGRKGARPVGLQIREDIRFQRIGPVGTQNVEQDGGDGEVVSEQEYKHDIVEMGPRARGEAFLKWPWRLVRCKG
jgi:hypothetical protein